LKNEQQVLRVFTFANELEIKFCLLPVACCPLRNSKARTATFALAHKQGNLFSSLASFAFCPNRYSKGSTNHQQGRLERRCCASEQMFLVFLLVLE
jgi:hypothetical protein